MPIKFRCEKCGKQFQVKDELAGRRANCKCGQSITIPHPEPEAGLADLFDDELSNLSDQAPTLAAPATSPPASPASSRGKSKPRKRKRRETLEVAAAVVCIIYGGYGLLSTAWALVVLVIGGFAVFGILMIGTTVLQLAMGALAGFLLYFGIGILRREKGAFERAGQICMVYIAIMLLGLLISVPGAISVLSSTRQSSRALDLQTQQLEESLANMPDELRAEMEEGLQEATRRISPPRASAVLLLILGFLFQLIHFIPPGFVLWAERECKT